MNVNTSKLGILELVGYLLSGVLAATLVAVPFLLMPIDLVDDLPKFNDLGLFGGAAMLSVCFGLGLFVSSASLRYYEGRWPVKKPEMHPNAKPRNVLWDQIERHARENDVMKPFVEMPPNDAADRNETFCGDLLYGLAYETSHAPLIEKLAAITRFSSSAVVASPVGAAIAMILLSCSACQGEDAPPGIIIKACHLGYSQIYLVLYITSCFAAACFAHRLAKNIANYYWMYVAFAVARLNAGGTAEQPPRDLTKPSKSKPSHASWFF